jgi:hypothetical protein
VIALELAGIVAALACMLAAGEATRRAAACVVASMPGSLRERQDVAERYAVLDRPSRLRDSTRALATSGWTITFVAFFTLLAAIDVTVAFSILLAGAFALFWGAADYSQRRREEDAFLAGVTGQQPHRHLPLAASYFSLNVVEWSGWLVAAALAGQLLADALSL